MIVLNIQHNNWIGRKLHNEDKRTKHPLIALNVLSFIVESCTKNN